jgi:hypothetical protein
VLFLAREPHPLLRRFLLLEEVETTRSRSRRQWRRCRRKRRRNPEEGQEETEEAETGGGARGRGGGTRENESCMLSNKLKTGSGHVHIVYWN